MDVPRKKAEGQKQRIFELVAQKWDYRPKSIQFEHSRQGHNWARIEQNQYDRDGL